MARHIDRTDEDRSPREHFDDKLIAGHPRRALPDLDSQPPRRHLGDGQARPTGLERGHPGFAPGAGPKVQHLPHSSTKCRAGGVHPHLHPGNGGSRCPDVSGELPLRPTTPHASPTQGGTKRFVRDALCGPARYYPRRRFQACPLNIRGCSGLEHLLKACSDVRRHAECLPLDSRHRCLRNTRKISELSLAPPQPSAPISESLLPGHGPPNRSPIIMVIRASRLVINETREQLYNLHNRGAQAVHAAAAPMAGRRANGRAPR